MNVAECSARIYGSEEFFVVGISNSMKTKVLYIPGSILPSKTANSVHVMKMCQALTKTGADVELLAYTRDTEYCVDTIFFNYGIRQRFPVTLLSIRSANQKFFKNIVKIFALLKKRSLDTIVYGRDVNSLLLASLLGFKVFYESHGMPVSKLHEMVERRLLRSKNLRKVVVISEKLKGLYTSGNRGVSAEACLVLHDAADIIPIHTEKTALGDGVHVGYTGSLHHEGRGIDLILAVARKNKDFTFHLVGGSFEEVKFWRGKAPENVRFHGFIDNRSIPGLLLSFDVVLMPYQRNLRFEGMNYNPVEWMSPMKMFEYMAAETAIISSDLPVIREILNDENSLLVGPEDVEAWSRSIRILYEDSELRSRLAGEAHKSFLAKYTWDRRAELLLSNFHV